MLTATKGSRKDRRILGEGKSLLERDKAGREPPRWGPLL
jgi:hypothetical protein